MWSLDSVQHGKRNSSIGFHEMSLHGWHVFITKRNNDDIRYMDERGFRVKDLRSSGQLRLNTVGWSTKGEQAL